MKEKITGIISFLGSISWGTFAIYILFDQGTNSGIFQVFTILLTFASSALYVIWTKFGKKEFSELEKIDNENQILKRQIEQKELKKKLEE